ncbi:MAG: hypothetical protein AAF481_02600 [Acidobacteriota bacterium]
MKKTLLFAALVSLVAVPALAGGSLSVSNFPTAGEYVINSHPSFLINVGDTKEVIECDATLRLRASDPYVTASGAKRVDLTVLDWKADGFSKLLDGELNFRMRQGAEPVGESYVESYQQAGTHDFPAQAQFAVPYEVETPFGTIAGLHGITRGSIKAFPPSGDIFLMEKGDIGDLMADIMPAPLSALSAAGDTREETVEVQPISCLCPAADAAPVDRPASPADSP